MRHPELVSGSFFDRIIYVKIRHCETILLEFVKGGEVQRSREPEGSAKLNLSETSSP
jgi:hypothetical protein